MVPYIKTVINKDGQLSLCSVLCLTVQHGQTERRFRSACVSFMKVLQGGCQYLLRCIFCYKWHTNIQTTSTSRAPSCPCQWVSLVRSPLTLAACWASITAHSFLLRSSLRTAETPVAELWTETSTPCTSCGESCIRRTTGQIKINKRTPLLSSTLDERKYHSLEFFFPQC